MPPLPPAARASNCAVSALATSRGTREQRGEAVHLASIGGRHGAGAEPSNSHRGSDCQSKALSASAMDRMFTGSSDLQELLVNLHDFVCSNFTWLHRQQALRITLKKQPIFSFIALFTYGRRYYIETISKSESNYQLKTVNIRFWKNYT